ncbi:exocyst complex component exo84 [Malassezia cuniculi]|uniref:Exocyst complex component EXO84 n=1 Tax=Malassezia cuniculi TaxID=948313 RepID=A0AAF0ERM4_9BASI|nr:exocyst complex component exo84 [Malassezia cuniculi]
MSRSLRTRPTTLYGKEGRPLPSINENGVEKATSPTQPRPAPKLAVPSTDATVRKRLSTRYGPGAQNIYSSRLSTLAPIASGTGTSSGNVSPVAMAVSTMSPVERASTSASAATIDLDTFAADSFDPRTYVLAQVQQQSESSLRALHDSLATVKDRTQRRLKEQVFKNYSEFITISKEIAVLENDMLEFKELLSEWQTLPALLQPDDALDPGLAGDGLRSLKGKGAVDLEQIYRAQLSALWENIEGSQKYVPYVPGRHLIAETSQFVELNAATYKPEKSVALFLLDDMLLVAIQKKRHYGNKVQLVAERCFNLSEIVIVDLKDGRDLSNAFKIKKGKEVYVYRTERTQDKRALLNAFRRVGEDLANRRKRESMKPQHKRPTTFGNADGDPDSNLALLATPDGTAPKGDSSIVPWLRTTLDDLAVCIAVRQWDKAVSLVEEANKKAPQPSSDSQTHVLLESLEAYTNALVKAISTELASPLQRKQGVVRNVGYMLRLDRAKEARKIFLDARTELLRRRTGQIKYEGDVSLYISELAVLYFTLIKNTGDWYMSAFPDYKVASGFVQWAAEQVRAYAQLFRRQVYGVDKDPQVIQETIQITMNCVELLSGIGLNMSFLMEELLRSPDMQDATDVPSLKVTDAVGA